jgi:hypothetical protein
MALSVVVVAEHPPEQASSPWLIRGQGSRSGRAQQLVGHGLQSSLTSKGQGGTTVVVRWFPFDVAATEE